MNLDKYDPVSFGRGFVYRRNLLYVEATSSELDEENVYHAIMFRILDKEWGHWTIENRITSHCVFDSDPGRRTVMSMGIDGRIQIADGSPTFRWEVVDTGNEAPSILRQLTTMRIIGKHIYVAGMARQVYRRLIFGNQWKKVDHGVLVPKNSLEIVGFNAIDGLHEEDLYAVGLLGQIWHYNGVQWRQLDSPTNVKLECVRCVTPDLVFIGGNNGIIIKGNKNKWEILENGLTEDTFWGMEYFLDSLYLSTDRSSIFKLEDNEIVSVDMNLGEEISTYSLHSNDGILLSVGPNDITVFDSNKWEKIKPPTS